jgi:hypothetical protein
MDFLLEPYLDDPTLHACTSTTTPNRYWHVATFTFLNYAQVWGLC